MLLKAGDEFPFQCEDLQLVSVCEQDEAASSRLENQVRAAGVHIQLERLDLLS